MFNYYFTTTCECSWITEDKKIGITDRNGRFHLYVLRFYIICMYVREERVPLSLIPHKAKVRVTLSLKKKR